MYPDVIKFRDPLLSITAILAVIVMALLSLVFTQNYTESGGNGLALLIAILVHIIILPIGLFFAAMAFNPPVATLSAEGIKVKTFPRTRFYKWSDVKGELKVSSMPGWPKFTRIHFIAFGEYQSTVYLVPLRMLSKWSDVLQTVKSYRTAALKAEVT